MSLLSQVKPCADIINQGKIAVIPTDTLYGIVCVAKNKKAVEKVYLVRNRDNHKPVIVLISKISDIEDFGITLSPSQKKDFAQIWPNAVTVILKCSDPRFEHLHRNSGGLSFRMPKNAFLEKLISATGPLIAPSANIQAKDPAITIADAKRYFGTSVDMYVDAGSVVSKPSTVIDYSGTKMSLVREGLIPFSSVIKSLDFTKNSATVSQNMKKTNKKASKKVVKSTKKSSKKISGKMAPIVISVGGSLIAPDGVDAKFVSSFTALMQKYTKKGQKFILITGGGKVARTYMNALDQIIHPKLDVLDWMGIYSTHLNAQFMRLALKKLAYSRVVINPNENFSFNGCSIIIAGGWKPGCSTDYDAVLFAKKIGAKKMINLSNIDYVYTKDPRKFPDAKRIDSISWKEYMKIIPKKWSNGLSTPFDPIASKEAQKRNIEVALINGNKLEEIEKYLEGKEFIGSKIGA